jgi:hypothetical protein
MAWEKALILTGLAVLIMIAVERALAIGIRWVDRMLHYKPLDPSKPIVRQPPD